MTCIEVLERGCLSLLEDTQTILNFTASFTFFWLYCVSLYIYGCVFCVLLFNFLSYEYVFSLLRLCILIFIYVPFCIFCFIVSFCVLFVCKCVLCTVCV
jgi:hypothetical protein